MKMKTNLYYLLTFTLAMSIIAHCSSKNVVLFSNPMTSTGKNCLFKNLIQSFKLKKLEKSVSPVENIFGGKIGDNNIIFYDIKSIKNNHTENSHLMQELHSKLIFHYNITTLDSILLFYALNDKQSTIENDIKTLVTNFGERILKSTAIVAINQRRLLNSKRTFLDSMTDKYNLSYVHISTLCDDKLENDIIIKDFNFLFKKTVAYDVKENQHPQKEKKSKSVYVILFMAILSAIMYVRRPKKKDVQEINTSKIIEEKKDQEKVKEKIEEETPCDIEEKEINMCSEEANFDDFEKEPLDDERNKDKIKKEMADILNNLQTELFKEEEEQEMEKFSNFTQPNQEKFKIEEEIAENEALKECDVEKVESIHLSDSEEKYEIETNAKSIIGTIGEKDHIVTKNGWEILD